MPPGEFKVESTDHYPDLHLKFIIFCLVVNSKNVFVLHSGLYLSFPSPEAPSFELLPLCNTVLSKSFFNHLISSFSLHLSKASPRPLHTNEEVEVRETKDICRQHHWNGGRSKLWSRLHWLWWESSCVRSPGVHRAEGQSQDAPHLAFRPIHRRFLISHVRPKPSVPTSLLLWRPNCMMGIYKPVIHKQGNQYTNVNYS